MLSRVLRTIREHDLLEAGHRLLVAVSGGPDSTALLHALVRLAPRLRISLEVATVDHGLRPAAAAEAREVARRCGDLGLSCEVLTVDVAAAQGPHVSLQDAARRVRLAALAGWAAARGCSRVALGHTADDQAETILFRIVRGTAVAGLTGIPHRRDPFVRPLLEVRRHEVLAFLRRKRIACFDDPSNDDRRYTRSRIRHDWIPFLARENPRVVEALLLLGESARARPGGEQMTPVTAPPGTPRPALTQRTATQLRALVEQANGTHLIAVPGGVIEVAYGRATFLPANRQANRQSGAPARASDAVTQVAGPGCYEWPPRHAAPPGAVHLVETVEPAADAAPIAGVDVRLVGGAMGPPRDQATFAPEVLAAPLLLRSPRPGDRMRPRGGRGSRKLQDLLVDAKIPRSQRAALPVLTTAEGVVLFVPGLRPAEEARPAPEARSWIEIRVR